MVNKDCPKLACWNPAYSCCWSWDCLQTSWVQNLC